MKRTPIYVVSVLLAGAFCFTGGFLVGSLTMPRAYTEEIVKRPINTPPAESLRPVIETKPVQESYMISCEDNKLRLYSVSEEGREVVREENIDPGLYPEEDRQKLEKGIFAQSLEDALIIWENFV